MAIQGGTIRVWMATGYALAMTKKRTAAPSACSNRNRFCVAGMRQELRRRASHLTEVIGKRGSVFGGGSRETREVGATP
ncbi:MAG: hypothetical protein LBR60_04260, partial [Fibrobacter sp.]|nr:hypothetical protein [Fibrobacter sp.]